MRFTIAREKLLLAELLLERARDRSDALIREQPDHTRLRKRDRITKPAHGRKALHTELTCPLKDPEPLVNREPRSVR
jgi:hypothetical protein